jgi:hypothetical protein
MAYFRKVLDGEGYTSVTVHQDEETTGVPLPFVRFVYGLISLTSLKQTNDGGLQNNYRILLSVSVFGSLEGSGRQQARAIGGLLRTAFNEKRGQLDKIQSDIIVDLTTGGRKNNEQVYPVFFQVNAVVTYP